MFMKLLVLSVACLSSVLVHYTYSQIPSLKLVPSGIYGLIKPGMSIHNEILEHQETVGISLRQSWKQVEPTDANFNFSYFHTQMNHVSNSIARKKVLARIIAGGQNTPGWVMQQVSQTVTYLETNKYQSTYGTYVTIPVPWNSVFLSYKKRMIAKYGQAMVNRPRMVMIGMSCMNTYSDDWFFPSSEEAIQQWIIVGYTQQKLIDACIEILDATMTAFPDRSIVWPYGQTPTRFDEDVLAVARHVISYANGKYPGRFYPAKNVLSATTPTVTSNDLGMFGPVRENAPQSGFQMLWYSSGDETCRNNGRVTPCDPNEVLSRSLETGADYGVKYIEVYEQDLLDPAMGETIRNGKLLMQ